MRHLVPLAFALVLLSMGASAQAPQAEGSQDDEARGLFLAGRAAFDGGRYEEALTHFNRAYELSGRTDLLFNIGHTAQLAGDDAAALVAFRRYLAERPDAPDRARLETRIARLESREEQAVQETPAEIRTVSAPQRSVGPVVLLSAGAAVTAGGGLSLILAARSAHTVESAPDGTPWVEVEGDERAAQRRAILGGILLGAGAAAMLGGILWISVRPNDDVGVSLGPEGVSLRGRF